MITGIYRSGAADGLRTSLGLGSLDDDEPIPNRRSVRLSGGPPEGPPGLGPRERTARFASGVTCATGGHLVARPAGPQPQLGTTLRMCGIILCRERVRRGA
jgi:hypothetical protein